MITSRSHISINPTQNQHGNLLSLTDYPELDPTDSLFRVDIDSHMTCRLGFSRTLLYISERERQLVVTNGDYTLGLTYNTETGAFVVENNDFFEEELPRLFLWVYRHNPNRRYTWRGRVRARLQLLTLRLFGRPWFVR